MTLHNIEMSSCGCSLLLVSALHSFSQLWRLFPANIQKKARTITSGMCVVVVAVIRREHLLVSRKNKRQRYSSLRHTPVILRLMPFEKYNYACGNIFSCPEFLTSRSKNSNNIVKMFWICTSIHSINDLLNVNYKIVCRLRWRLSAMPISPKLTKFQVDRFCCSRKSTRR